MLAQDQLVRVRSNFCPTVCESCSELGAPRRQCTAASLCTPKAATTHGHKCCTWQANPQLPVTADPVLIPQSDAQIEKHSEELFRRLRWCAEKGPEFWPANTHIHLAPGDDANFVFGVPPWFADGSPNTAAIPDAHSSVRGLLPQCGAMIAEMSFGYECTKCEKWVDLQPRPFDGVEPPWWWWCNACRVHSNVGTGKSKSKKELAIEQLAKQNKSLGFGPASRG